MRGSKEGNSLSLACALVRFTLFDFFDICLGYQSFSAVVGPNGSGKSNVIDAMLFVFGKRAKQV
jgi:AAA15 family ATPase/GTPase